MLDLGVLGLSIKVDTNTAKQELQNFSDEATSSSGILSKVGGIAKTAAIGVAAMGTAAIGAGTAALKMAEGSAETADRIDKMSQKIGLSKTGFQEWDYVCNQSGVEVEVFKNGMKTLTTQMTSAQDGTSSAVEAFKTLGITWEDGNGQLKDQETMMNEAITALSNMKDGTERATLAQQLFGKAGTELAPILNSGSDGIAELKDNAHALGLVMSDETIDAGVHLGDTIDDVKASFGAITTKIGAEFMPIIQQVADFIIANMPTIQAVIETVFSVVQMVINTISPLITGLIAIISDMVTSAQTEGTAFNAIWKGIQAVFEAVIAIIKSVFKAFDDAFKGDWKGFWNDILNIITGFKDAFKAAGKAVFTALWDGLKDIWTSISTWVSDKVSWIINSITSALSFAGSSGGGGRTSGSHRNGLEEVPYDGYIAELHKGEMVLTAAEANQYKSGSVDLVNALSTVLGMSNQNTNQPVYLTVQVGTEKLGETIVNLYDDTTAQLGTRKVVKV